MKNLQKIFDAISLFDDGLKEYNNINYKKAKKLWEKAANQGLANAQSNLGFMYDNGRCVRQNKSKVKELFGQACDNGLQRGCHNYKILNQQAI
jgi:TPR repeat protein